MRLRKREPSLARRADRPRPEVQPCLRLISGRGSPSTLFLSSPMGRGIDEKAAELLDYAPDRGDPIIDGPFDGSSPGVPAEQVPMPVVHITRERAKPGGVTPATILLLAVWVGLIAGFLDLGLMVVGPADRRRLLSPRRAFRLDHPAGRRGRGPRCRPRCSRSWPGSCGVTSA